MTRTSRYRLRRRAIGLVELMVAMALSIGIMWILAESIKMGLDFTRHAKSTGTMMNQLDGVRAVFARDLLNDHFYPDDNRPNRGVRLSDQRLDWLTSAGQGWTPPPGGFFRIISPTTTPVTQDSDGFWINSATNHAIHCTVVLPANDPNPFTATINGVRYTSLAAEVAYLLVDSGIRTSPGAAGQPLYHLIRRQRLIALSGDEIASLMPAPPALNWATADPTGNYNQVIATNAAGTSVYTLAQIRDKTVRLQVEPSALPGATGSPLMLSGARFGEDILISNVLSFEVLADWGPNLGGIVNSAAAPRTPPVNWEPCDYLAVNAGQNSTYSNMGVFDTWAPYTNWNTFAAAGPERLPLAVRVKTIQATVRIFDTKTRQARQSSWKFSM